MFRFQNEPQNHVFHSHICAYDTENHVTDIYDAVSNHTHFTYSGAGSKLTQITFPSGYLEKYTWYEGCNAPANRTDRNNVTIPFIYDFECRLWRKTWPGALVTQYNYDAANRLTSATDPSGTYSFGYDNMNRLTAAATNYAFDSAGTFTVQYGYDAASNRTSMTDPQGQNTTYSYDSLNRGVAHPFARFWRRVGQEEHH